MEEQSTEKKKIFDIIKSNLKIVITTIFLLLVIVSVYSWLKFKEDVKKINLSENYIEAKIMLSQKKPKEALAPQKEKESSARARRVWTLSADSKNARPGHGSEQMDSLARARRAWPAACGLRLPTSAGPAEGGGAAGPLRLRRAPRATAAPRWAPALAPGQLLQC